MLIDTFPAFLNYWDGVKSLPIEEQIDAWADVYLSHWPELLEKQAADYKSQDLDWRVIAREKVFPFLPQRLDAMCVAHKNLPSLCETTLHKAQQVLNVDVDPAFVIHVGLGCGAGWVTSFQGRSAILFGLENIAECGWERESALEGLIAHELGHVIHYHWRDQAGKPLADSAWTQLFDEGMAQYCERAILPARGFHQGANPAERDWLAWCETHQAQLAREFLRVMDAGEPVFKFFGSWFEFEDHSETGYFLGYKAIESLAAQGYALREIALLDPGKVVRPILKEMAEYA